MRATAGSAGCADGLHAVGHRLLREVLTVPQGAHLNRARLRVQTQVLPLPSFRPHPFPLPSSPSFFFSTVFFLLFLLPIFSPFHYIVSSFSFVCKYCLLSSANPSFGLRRNFSVATSPHIMLIFLFYFPSFQFKV